MLSNNLNGLTNGSEIYNHFLSLSISTRILLNPKLCQLYQEYARDLLIHFVSTPISLYGVHYITYNFHALTHIADDVTNFGCLDFCSTFQFGFFLQFFKSKIRKSDKPLQQIIERLKELAKSNIWFNGSSEDSSNFKVSGEHYNGPVLETCNSSRQYKEIQFSTFTLTSTSPNSYCFLKNGNIVNIKNVIYSNRYHTLVILCSEFSNKENFLGIHLISQETNI